MPFKQEQIHNRQDGDDGWESDFWNKNQQAFLLVDGYSSKHDERKHKIQAIANNYSILVLGMELSTGSWIHGRVMGTWSFIWMTATIVVTIRATTMHFKP
jgi:hypothetical protein